jgi:hypothetical protein
MPTLTKTCLYLLCTALLLLNACKPDKPEEKVYLGYFPATVPLQYLYFKPGSYWVYECDSTGELDSQIMVKCDTPWLRKTYIDYQFILYNKKSITYNSSFNTYYASMDISYDKKDKDKYYFFNSISTKMPSNSALDCVFFYPFDSSFYGGIGSSPTYYKGHYDSMQVLGRWYKDVRVFKVQATSGWIKLNSWRLPNLNHLTSVEYYWSKYMGLIRTRVFTYDNVLNKPFTHNWNLKRYLIQR